MTIIFAYFGQKGAKFAAFFFETRKKNQLKGPGSSSRFPRKCNVILYCVRNFSIAHPEISEIIKLENLSSPRHFLRNQPKTFRGPS